MSLTIPTSTERSDYVQTTTLDGRDYIFRFLFNQREGKWYMRLADQDDVPIVEGVKLVADYNLLKRIVDARRPPGYMIAKDTTALDVDVAAGEKITALDPGLPDLGGRVLLLYFTEAEVAAF